ncbi:MAG: transglycosylase SLT domain-containing protein, partial [Acidobacteriota bacterium]
MIAAIGVAVWFSQSGEASHDEPDLPQKAEAPPDLEKLRDTYAAGTAALDRKDGPDAVKHLASFSFKSRAVEEYRLFYLAAAYALTGNSAAERSTLAVLWRREPRMLRGGEAGLSLASLYEKAGDFARGSEVYNAVARRERDPAVSAKARWGAARARLYGGDLAGALFNARTILIANPASNEAKDARALIRALTGVPETAPLPLTPSERLSRATALMGSGKPDDALLELDALERAAPQLRTQIRLERGVALHLLRRYEESNKVLEPLTSGAFKQAIPALRYSAKNYAVVASSINPETIKTVKERKKVGTVKQTVGKGKKKKTVTKPKYQTVFRQVKLIDLPKKQKKDEYTRLASERLKDLLSLPIDDDVRVETLDTLITRAASKNQDEYVQELVPQLIKLDPSTDPALQHFWDKGWAAWVRGDLAAAKTLFRYIADTYTHPNVRRQSEYWFARTIERQGQKAEAHAIYQRLASAPYEDLYAQYSVARGAKRTENKTNPLRRAGPDWRTIAEKEMPRELELAYELTALSSMRDATLEAQKNARRVNNRFAHAILADVYHSAGNPLAMYTSLRKAWPQLATVDQDSVPLYFFRMYYPLRYGEEIEKRAKEQKLDPNLVRGLILQESYYNPKAKSRVGATGLMQLMPPTAKEHAQRMGVRYSQARLEDPDLNIRLGTFHLRMLVNLFSGQVPLAIASYNAGQGNVMKWRRAAPRKPMDEL